MEKQETQETQDETIARLDAKAEKLFGLVEVLAALVLDHIASVDETLRERLDELLKGDGDKDESGTL